LNPFFSIRPFYPNPFGQKLPRRLRKRGVVGVRLSPRLYRCLTLASEPQGIGAVGAAAMDSTPARSTHGAGSVLKPIPKKLGNHEAKLTSWTVPILRQP